MSRLSTQVVVLALAALAATLVVVGLGTGAVLWVVARHGQDQALLAAAAAEAHPQPAERWRPEHLVTPVRVRLWASGDPLVADDVALATMADERSRWLDRDGQRVLLLVAEPTDVHGAAELGDPDHPHALLIAHAPQISIAQAIGPFAAAYGAIGLVTAWALGALLVLGLRRALAPLDEAAHLLDHLGGRELGARVPTEGPDEIRQVLTATNALLERLERATAGQRRFVADAAHELRTPVTRLLGELDLALRQDRDAEAYREALVHGRREAARLRDLVEALLTLARLDAGQGRADRERQRERVSGVVLSALAAERATLDDAGCAVDLDVGDDPEVLVDAALCRIAIGNLLRNAAIHAPGAPVHLRVDTRDGDVLVLVEDGGPGMTEAARTAAFERFHRGTHDRPGLGLGLPLAREIARHHGGDLTLGASDLGGLAARIRLPASTILRDQAA